VIERAAILCKNDRIGIEWLPPNLVSDASTPTLATPLPWKKWRNNISEEFWPLPNPFKEAADILGIDQATLWRRRKNTESEGTGILIPGNFYLYAPF